MDRLILGKTQLAQLRDYIAQKGFRDPSVQSEILDHFASKVEEIITEEPGICFDTAMKKAHHSFGVRGFRPIVEVYEKSIVQDYKKWRWKEARNVLMSLHLPGLLLVAALFLSAFRLYNMQPPTDRNILLHPLVILFFSYSVVEILLITVFFRKYRKSFVVQVVNGHRRTFSLIFILAFINVDNISRLPLTAAYILIALFSFLGAFNLLLQYRHLQKVQREEEQIRSVLC